MLMVLSPAKTLDYESPLQLDPSLAEALRPPRMLAKSQSLIKLLRQLDLTDIQSLMSISEPLAKLNHQRFADWRKDPKPEVVRPAALAFNGDVYDGLQAKLFEAEDWVYAQKSLRILSGLYGVLKPLDLMQPYRLEMGSRLANGQGKDLYAFWGETITDLLNQDFEAIETKVLLNLASDEYFKAVKPKSLKAKVVTAVFQEARGDDYKIISFLAKRARGLMAAWVIRNRVDDPKGLLAFDQDGYRYVAEASNDDRLVFRR